MAVIIRGNQTIALLALFFAVAWLYGMIYYWNAATNITQTQIGLEDKDVTGISSITGEGGILAWFFDTVLEIFSWVSPFILLKGLIYYTTSALPDLYTFLNLFFLRPVGWICTYMTIEWAVFTGRGRSE